MLRFTIFHLPVQVHWLFWLTSAVLGGGFYARTPADWMRVAVWTAVVFISIMLHELGHALVGRRFSAQPAIVLHGLGGVTILRGLQASRAQSVLVSLAGPVAGLALGIAVLVIAPVLDTGSALARTTLAYLLWVNIFWSLFNLLPILPMDGGQVLRSILGPSRERAASIVGALAAGALCLGALALRQWFIAIFMGVLAFNNYRRQSMLGGVIRQ